jgi:hypothetical protein
MFSSVLGHNELGGLRMNISLSAYIPKSGKQVLLRNVRTKSTWLASFNYITGRYHFQPVGNVKAIKREFESTRMPCEFEPAGTR